MLYFYLLAIAIGNQKLEFIILLKTLNTQVYISASIYKICMLKTQNTDQKNKTQINESIRCDHGL